MKVKLLLFTGQEFVDANLHEDFAGVTTYQHGRGEFKVKEIRSVSFGDDGVTVYAQPLERDLPEPPVVEEALPVVIGKPANLEPEMPF